MQFPDTENKLENLIIELEKKFFRLRKVDIFKAVSNAYKIVHPLRHLLTSKEIEDIKQLATQDLS